MSQFRWWLGDRPGNRTARGDNDHQVRACTDPFDRITEQLESAARIFRHPQGRADGLTPLSRRLIRSCDWRSPWSRGGYRCCRPGERRHPLPQRYGSPSHKFHAHILSPCWMQPTTQVDSTRMLRESGPWSPRNCLGFEYGPSPSATELQLIAHNCKHRRTGESEEFA